MKLSCTKYMLFLAVALLLLGAAACTQSKPVVPTQTLAPLTNATALLPQAVTTETTPGAQGTAPAAVTQVPQGTEVPQGTPAPGEPTMLPTPTVAGGQPSQPSQPEQPTAAATQAAPPGGGQQAGGACPSPYTVQRGEWLYSIARKCGVSAGAIMAANPGQNLNTLYPGQTLTMPGGSSSGGQPSGGQPSGGNQYTVKPGDTLFSIARRFNTTASAIMAANGISNPNFIFVGQVLNIP